MRPWRRAAPPRPRARAGRARASRSARRRRPSTARIRRRSSAITPLVRARERLDAADDAGAAAERDDRDALARAGLEQRARPARRSPGMTTASGAVAERARCAAGPGRGSCARRRGGSRSRGRSSTLAAPTAVDDRVRQRARRRRARPPRARPRGAARAVAELVAQHRQRRRRRAACACSGSPQPHHFAAAPGPRSAGSTRRRSPTSARSIPSSASSRRRAGGAAHHRAAEAGEPAQRLLAGQRHLGRRSPSGRSPISTRAALQDALERRALDLLLPGVALAGARRRAAVVGAHAACRARSRAPPSTRAARRRRSRTSSTRDRRAATSAAGCAGRRPAPRPRAGSAAIIRFAIPAASLGPRRRPTRRSPSAAAGRGPAAGA